MQVGDDPRPVGERVGLAARRAAAGAEAACRARRARARRRRSRGLRPRRAACSHAASVVVLGEARDRRGAELGLLGHARRRRDGGLGRARPRAARARSRSEPARRSPPRSSSAARTDAVAGRAHVHALAQLARDGGPRRRAASSAGARAPSPAARAATVGPRGRRRARRTAARPRSAAASRSAGRGRGRRPARSPGSRRGSARPRPPPSPREVARSASIRPSSLLALRPPRRVAEPLGREEGRDGERLRVAEREVGEARQPRLEAVHDVVARPGASASARFARTPTGTPSLRPPRDGHAGPTAITSAGWPRCSARRPAQEVGGAARRREHRHRVAERAQRCAIPATCSFTSCGCDQANGVTRQMRRLTRRV